MIPHEQIDEALVRSLPPAQRYLTEDALRVVGAYAKTRGLAWEDIYAMAEKALSQTSERATDAANDEPPLRHSRLRPVFGNDEKILDGVFWLYAHHVTARAMVEAISLDKISDIAASFGLPIPNPALKSEFVLQRMMAAHAGMLEKFGITPQVAKQSSRYLKDELTKLCAEQSVSPSTPSR
jgi:hypothetical protein